MSTRTQTDVQRELAGALARVAALQAELERFSLVDRDQGAEVGSRLVGEPGSANPGPTCGGGQLSLREYERYGRQMILPEVGLPGQLKLKQSHVLIVGAGGLGCPVLAYLAAAGIGEITLYDHDTVELSNLHRQVLHNESRIGMPKATSAALSLMLLNSDVQIHPCVQAFSPSLFGPATSSSSHLLSSRFDLVIDCTDNPTTRQFVNTFAVANGIPLVSGGAVRSEGVVGVYHSILPPQPSAALPSSSGADKRGPCYACVFPALAAGPATPGPDTLSAEVAEERAALLGTGNCSDEGVLGILCAVVGAVMGSEALRVLLGTAVPTLHLLSPLSQSPFRTIKLRPRSKACLVCCLVAPPPTLSESRRVTLIPTLAAAAFNHLRQTGEYPWSDPLCTLPTPADKAGTQLRWSASELSQLIDPDGVPVGTRLIDVRSPTEFGICRIEGSLNIPFKTLLKDPSLALAAGAPDGRIVMICRRGNESFLAARALRRFIGEQGATGGEARVIDVVGGLLAWRGIAEQFPLY